jgi:hypothetical protein
MNSFAFLLLPHSRSERTKKKKRHVRITHTYTTVATVLAICEKERRSKLVTQNGFVYYENVD